LVVVRTKCGKAARSLTTAICHLPSFVYFYFGKANDL
jgi:hypothetical protein